MPTIKNLGNKITPPQRPLETKGVDKKATTTTTTTTAAPGGVAAQAAQRALGFADVKTEAPKTAGAKAAVHGLGFLQRTMGSMRKGALVAIAGLSLMQSVAPVKTAVTAFPLQHTQSLDVRGSTITTGQRALPEAQKLLQTWTDQAQNGGGPLTLDTAKATELLLAGLSPAVPSASDDLSAFSKANLGADTKQLIRGLLDQSAGFLKLDPQARAFLEVAIGRAHAVSLDGKVRVLSVEKGAQDGQGLIKLKGVPGASVEVVNLSTIPTKRLHTDDTFALGTVSADGSFSGAMDMQPGDVIRLRLKLPDGTATEFVDFKGTGIGDDTRQAEAALFRVGLVDAGNGTINVTNINEGRPVSEPGAVMRFVNTRTNEATDVTFDKNGTFAAGQTIPGKTGDTFSIRITDGVNDKELAREISTLTVREAGKPSVNTFDLKDPTLHHDEMTADGKPKFSLERFTGPLFDASGAEYNDVTQGQLGDCYFPASISTIAFHVKGTFEKIIEQKREVDQVTGEEKVWYEVHFKERQGWGEGAKFKDVTVKVDGDLYLRSWGGPLYGSDDGARDPQKMELWFSILEKAYAEYKGDSYEAIGNGGSMDNVFRDILGLNATSMGIYNKDSVWKTVTESVDKHRPIGAGTHGESEEALYANTGVYADHAYSILGYKTDDKGVQYVKLRNPWGESEPFPGDGKNDGVFFLKLDDFMKLYQTLYYVTQDAPAPAPGVTP